MAAAYGALVSLLNDLVDIQNHPRHSFSFDSNQIQSLRESVTFLIGFMESYDNCHGPSKEAAQLLEMPITRAAYAAEEVIESHVVDQIRAGSTRDGKKRSPSQKKRKKRSHFLPDLQKVIEGVDVVRREAMEVQAQRGIKLKQQPTNSATAASSTPPITSEKNSMVGFDEVLHQLLDQLTGHPPSRRVISIVGTGGIGKTTLARNAFEHRLIVEAFDVCVWATISQQYVVQDILYKLLSLEGKSNGETVGELGEQLHKRLFGRKYLIVLDDMWSVGSWEEIKFFFPDTSNGSRVVVTTRQSDVAHHLSSSKLAMSFLDDEKSWNLFCEKAFAGKGCPPELEEVGMKIVKKCKGLPLAIVVVAGHLAKSSRMEEHWESVSNNMSSTLNSEENYKQLLDVLSFSYSHLPVHLKPCFVFMGMLKEDEKISVPEIIQRWIAEGYLKPCNADNWEEIAEDYLKDLIDRNLILADKDFCEVGIHDVMRELCLKIAEEEMIFYVVETPQAICREREVDTPIVRSLTWPAENEWWGLDHHFRLFRVVYRSSLRCPAEVVCVYRSSLRLPAEGEVSFDLRLLRVMYKYDQLNRSYLQNLEPVINLRYLQYERNDDSSIAYEYLHISPSISLLWNLQTLIIQGGISTCVPPYEIWEMLQLRHVDVLDCIRLPSVKSDQGNELVMRNLRTLKRVKNFKMSEEVCRRVPNIKELSVEYDYYDNEYNEVRWSYYCPHNLGSFRKLESLNCRLGWREFGLSLTFPSSLKKLSMECSYLEWEEMEMMVGSLPHLETLKLGCGSVTSSEWNPVEGKFLRLKNLHISSCNNLVSWNADSSCFPVLENLKLIDLYRLEEFPSGIGEIPTLGSVVLKGCSVSCSISAVRVVVEQVEEFENQDLRLRVSIVNDEERESLIRKVEEESLTSNNVSIHKPNVFI